jgi:hypothetical protein
MNPEHINGFFSTARERYSILLRRRAGAPWPWTEDPVFLRWRFCNVHREDDRTTRWFAREVRGPLAANPRAVYRATVAFRWYNRIETGSLLRPWLLADEWPLRKVLNRLKRNSPPYVTGAYIVQGLRGYKKAEGVARAIDEFRRTGPRIDDITAEGTLQAAHWLIASRVRAQGTFTAYEVVTDLRHTCALCEAPDIFGWCYVGPGARRGLSRLLFGHPDGLGNPSSDRFTVSAYELGLCQDLLALARIESYWPAEWPAWEMREVEHWLCEYDKYERGAAILAGRPGSMKRRYLEKERKELI